MARHQRMPTEEAGYTYAVVPTAIDRLAIAKIPAMLAIVFALILDFLLLPALLLLGKRKRETALMPVAERPAPAVSSIY
jgi:hypothetical protein